MIGSFISAKYIGKKNTRLSLFYAFALFVIVVFLLFAVGSVTFDYFQNTGDSIDHSMAGFGAMMMAVISYPFIYISSKVLLTVKHLGYFFLVF